MTEEIESEKTEIETAELKILKLKAEMADLFILINQAETAKNQAAARINQIQAELK